MIEFIGAVKDVTERKQSENALNEMRSELAHTARVATRGRIDGVDRARNQSTALWHHHEREYVVVDVGRRSS